MEGAGAGQKRGKGELVDDADKRWNEGGCVGGGNGF